MNVYGKPKPQTQSGFALCANIHGIRSGQQGLSLSSGESSGLGSASSDRPEYGLDNQDSRTAMALCKDLISKENVSKGHILHENIFGIDNSGKNLPLQLPKDSKRGVTNGRTIFFKKLSNKIDFLIRNSLEKETDFLVARIVQGIRKSGYDDSCSEGNYKKSTHMEARFDLEYLNQIKMSKQNLDYEENEELFLDDEMVACPSAKLCPSDHAINEDLARTKNNQSATEKMNQFEDMNESPQSPNFDLINGFDLSLLNDPNFDLNFLDHNLRGDLTNHMDIDQDDFLSADNAPYTPCGETFDNMLFKMLNEVDEPCNDRINENKQDTTQDYEDFSTMNEGSITMDFENLSNLEKITPTQDYEVFSTMNEGSVTKDSGNLSNLEKITPIQNYEDLSTMNEGGITKDSENLTNLENISHAQNFEDLNTMDGTNNAKDSGNLGILEKSVNLQEFGNLDGNLDNQGITLDSEISQGFDQDFIQGTPYNFEDLDDILVGNSSQDNQKGVTLGTEMPEGFDQDFIQGTPYNFEDLDDILVGNSSQDNQKGVTLGTEMPEGFNQGFIQGTPHNLEDLEDYLAENQNNQEITDQQETLERDNPHRTRSKTVKDNTSFSNIDTVKLFMEILNEAGAKEAPKPYQLQVKKPTTCPSCGITTGDMLKMLKHFSSMHYILHKQESTTYFCSICNFTTTNRRDQKRHITTNEHISRTFIKLLHENNINISKELNKSVENYIKALPHLDLANQTESILQTDIEMIHTIIIYVCCIYHKWHNTKFSKDPIRFLSSLNKEIGQWIIFSHPDISKLPNTRLNYKEKKRDIEHRDRIGMIKENKQKSMPAIIRNEKIENPNGTITLVISCKTGTENSLEAAKLSLMQIYKMAKRSTWGIGRKLKGHRFNNRKNYQQIPTLVLQCQTNNKEEITSTNEFFSNLFKTVKMSKSNIVKQLEGKIFFFPNTSHLKLEEENIIQVDGMDSPPQEDSDDENQHSEDGIDTVNTVFETGTGSDKSFGTGFNTINTVTQQEDHEFYEIEERKPTNINKQTNKHSICKGRSIESKNQTQTNLPKNMLLSSVTFKDFNKLEENIEPESIRRFLSLKERHRNRQTAYNLSKSQLDMYRTMAKNPAITPIIEESGAFTNNLKEEMDSIEKTMLNLANTKKNIDFVEPKYGTKSTFNPTILGLFPRIKPGTNRRVKTTWNSIANVIEEQELNKEAGKNLLGAVIDGDMIDIFELYSHHDGREIAIKLSSIYDVPLNKAKYLDDLQKFCKKDGENCERAISRLKTILIGIETNKRPGERTIDTEIQLRHHLRQIIGDSIWFNVESDERKNLQEGRVLTIEQLAKRCDSKHLEVLERKRPDMTINLNTLSVGPNAPLRNANKFTEREARYIERENREKTIDHENRKTQKQRIETPMEIDPPMDMDSSIDRDLLEATRKTPIVAHRKLPLNNDKGTEYNHEKKNPRENLYQQDRTHRDPKETESYSNIKRTNDWDKNGRRGGINGQQNYSYDRDRQINNHQRENNYDNNGQQPITSQQNNIGQRSYFGKQEGPNNQQARFNFQTPPQQRYDGYQKQQQPETRGYQNQNRQGATNFGDAYRGRGSSYNRGYQRGSNRRGIIKYVAMPRILYDQICENDICKAPDAIVHHKSECPRLRNDERQPQTNAPPQGF